MVQNKPKSSIRATKTNINDDRKSLVPIHTPLDAEDVDITPPPPLISSYNDRIRPLLDAVDKLRNLKVMKEGIQLPTIVVVGDQSSGKSSVLESLAGISLPRGQGICTRVPLIMRLQHHSSPDPELFLEYMGKNVRTDEANVSDAINFATQEIAGNAKGISNAPITLVVKKHGVPDLTMVDLPGITRVPVHGQPENIYEQIRDIIMEYITPEESIVLNVLSATVDFSTCESIMMSQSVDKTGQRTLAVVTKADKAPEGLLEKVTNDDVSIGLGYVCVRNRIGEETYEEARLEEARLFGSHPLLSRIDDSIVGVPVLAQRLVHIQASIISKCLPNIVKQIDAKLNANVAELNSMPQNLSSVAEAMAVFMQIMGSAKESLRKILIRGEYEEYPEEIGMHCTARLAEMLDRFSEQLKSMRTEEENTEFLMEEVRVLEEAKGISLPNFLPRGGFLTILQRKVKGISGSPVDFVNKVWQYIENVVVKVLMHHCDNYPPLQSSTRRAANSLINKMKDQSVKRVVEIVEMEKIADYTCNPDYMTTWTKLMTSQDEFMRILEDESEKPVVKMKGFGKVKIKHLRMHKHVAQQALDMKIRMTAYWTIVLRRLVDSMALHLLFSIQNLVNKELEYEIVNELMGPYGGGIERMLEESPSVATKRDRLNKSIKLLKESKDVVSKIMDRIALTE
ncbi:dynamin-related protein 4C-like [Chenopodium quinoa]|uniref:Dynamin-related protein 4C-like n=1 Tax=Chenopodium quinoa TaxID=63459 RepID=A0A803KMV3_CHEQI|nr:dynamin-related protein 4C-like [Chenopodium quinoa]